MADPVNAASVPDRTASVTLDAASAAGIFLVLASPVKRDAVSVQLDGLLAGTDIAARPAGPDKWLVVVRDARAAEEVWARLSAGLGQEASLLDQSDGRILFTARGPDVREMLAKGSGLDIDPAAFPEDGSATTAFGHVTVHITRAAPDSYDIVVMTSFAGSLWESLCDASREFGCSAPQELPGLV